MLRKKIRPAALFLVLSLIVHLTIWLSFQFVSAPTPQNQTVEISLVTSSDVQLLDQKKVQIVAQKKQINDVVDKTAKYLSQFNQKVVKETRAEKSGKFENTPARGASLQGRTNGKKITQYKKHARPKKGELPSIDDILPKYDQESGQSLQADNSQGDGSQTDDYLKKVNKGLQTLLTTKEFVYYAYYNRIKRQLSQYWEPDVRDRVKIIYKEGRNIASTHDRVTKLLIILDKTGALLKVKVLTQSGIHELDDAAIQAFKSAAPFPHPPKGMIQKDGTIQIRWDFVLEA